MGPTACRVLSAEADGVPGVFVERFAEGATLVVYEGVAPTMAFEPQAAAAVLDALHPFGVRGVYRKRFARDRSRLGGALPEDVRDPVPAAGEPVPEVVLVRENACVFEVRLFDGLSTGLFLDQRENRRFVHEWVRSRRSSGEVHVLNTFAYTCAFSVAAATAGATVASVDVSPRYLEWGRRNFLHNSIAPETHRFARMDTFEFCSYARRKAMLFDLIILDPPSFASGSKKKGVRPWSSVADYARLVGEARELLRPRGVILASTNTGELCRPGRLEREIIRGLGAPPARWVRLPDLSADVRDERGRFASLAFEPQTGVKPAPSRASSVPSPMTDQSHAHSARRPKPHRS